MTGSRLVMITPKSMTAARTIWQVFKTDHAGLEKLSGWREGSLNKMAVQIECGRCRAMPETKCKTASGKTANRPHNDRFVAIIAAIMSLADEPIIKEEDCIEDVL